MKIKLLILMSIFIHLKAATQASVQEVEVFFSKSCSGKAVDSLTQDQLEKEATLLGKSSWRHLRLKYAELYGPEELVSFMDLFDMKVVSKMLKTPKTVYRKYPNVLYVLKLYHLALENDDAAKEKFLKTIQERDPFLVSLMKTTVSFPDVYFKAPFFKRVDLTLFENPVEKLNVEQSALCFFS